MWADDVGHRAVESEIGDAGKEQRRGQFAGRLAVLAAVGGGGGAARRIAAEVRCCCKAPGSGSDRLGWVSSQARKARRAWRWGLQQGSADFKWA